MNTQLHLFPAGALRLFESNQLEQLARQLARSLGTPLASPLIPEEIIVQSRGMGRWLSLQLAAFSGICMNTRFPFPREFFLRTLRVFFPELPEEDRWSPELLTWRLQKLLPAMAPHPAFSSVRQYLADGDPLKTYQLAEKVGRLFDQYLLYRPEMLIAWQREGAATDWQALLWRELVAQNNSPHLACIAAALPERMAAPPPKGSLPARVSVFGISSLPPLYLRTIFLLARHTEVNLFWLQPTTEYFGHDLPPKMRARLVARGGAVEESSGHALLTSLGKLNRDFTELRLELDEQFGPLLEEGHGGFIPPEGDSMLQVLQRDILQASPRGGEELPAIAISECDQSIIVQACHSPARELEVLYDQLLARFAADPTFRPRDVLVMTPDIESYAPFIHAIFGAPEDPARRIPYNIADRRSRASSPTLETFVELLAIPGSRCTATEIHALLCRAPIRRCFRFSDDELSQIKQWMIDSGIRWGIDAAHRRALGLPERAENTWRTGFDRLLLGFAMAGHHRTMFEHLLPCDEVEGSGGELLGRFMTAAETILAIASSWAEARPMGEWKQALLRLVDQLFAADEPDDVADLRLLRQTIDEIEQTARRAAAEDEQVEFRVLRAILAGSLEQSEARGGFLSGGVTFCALQPMRSIPARMIALLGMNDESFPRRAPRLAFDLLAARPKLGDRSSRDDDRYLFLETIISAREQLYISFLGRSVIDNELRPPSVFVSELLDELDRSFLFPGKKNAREYLITHHRLQAFSSHYFDAENVHFFSYSETNAAAARHLRQGAESRTSPIFLPSPLPAPEEPEEVLELSTLILFFENPTKHFLHRQLGIRRDERDDPLADDEPFSLAATERYHLREELVAEILEGSTSALSALEARQILPHGTSGAAHLLDLRGEAEMFSTLVRKALATAEAADPLLLRVSLSGTILTGKIQPLFLQGLIPFRSATLKPKDRLRAWIRHLALGVACAGKAHTTTLISAEGTLHFPPHPDAETLLQELVSLYQRGLRAPLPFFSASSLAFAETHFGEKPAAAWKNAATKWFGHPRAPGENADPHFSFCFGETNPLGEEFAELAIRIYGPMLGHQQAQP